MTFGRKPMALIGLIGFQAILLKQVIPNFMSTVWEKNMENMLRNARKNLDFSSVEAQCKLDIIAFWHYVRNSALKLLKSTYKYFYSLKLFPQRLVRYNLKKWNLIKAGSKLKKIYCPTAENGGPGQCYVALGNSYFNHINI